MPSTVGAQMSRKLDRMSSELQRARSAAVRSAGLAVVGSVRQEIQRASGDGRLSGVGRSGARVGARMDQRGEDTAVVKATGPVQLIERDTKPHVIGPKAKRGRSGRGGIRLRDGSVRRTVQHPGTKGKHPFEHGVEKARPQAVEEMRTATTSAVRRGMRA